jgi:uncharacterized protein (TIGR00290 family)
MTSSVDPKAESNLVGVGGSNMDDTDASLQLARGKDCLARHRGKRAAISFTGGKDCHLALQRSVEAGLEVVCLALFHSPPIPKFQAHRVEWQQTQADAIGIPLVPCCLSELEETERGVPLDYKSAYAAAIRKLHSEYNIDIIITGDIDYISSSDTNFMQQVCLEHDCHGVQVLLPLWQQARKELLHEMIMVHDFDIRLTCVKSPFFTGDWIGRRLQWDTVAELETKKGLDLNGENGEYHTMILNGPMYRKNHMSLLFDKVNAEELKNQRGQKVGEQWWVLSKASNLLPQA